MKRSYVLDIRLFPRSPSLQWWISEVQPRTGIQGYLFDCRPDSASIKDRLLRPLMGTHLLDHLELR